MIAKTSHQHETIDDLAQVFSALQTPHEAACFLHDLCTPAELSALAERWHIACLLDTGDMSYRDVARATGASTTTVTRVARFLRGESQQGYRLLLDRLLKKK